MSEETLTQEASPTNALADVAHAPVKPPLADEEPAGTAKDQTAEPDVVLRAERPLQAVRVYLDVLLGGGVENGPVFEASSDGDTWNGWACPYFTKAQADALVAAWNERFPAARARFDAADETFVFADPNGEEDEERFGHVVVGGERYWPVGSYQWCWSLEEA